MGKRLLILLYFAMALPAACSAQYLVDQVVTTDYRDSNLSNLLKPKLSLSNVDPSLGYFCKIENLNLPKTLFAYRMRLGSVDYVDYLEGK